MAEQCSTCRFWLRYREHFRCEMGMCRRHAPQWVWDVNGEYPSETKWPETESGDFCGDHEPEPGQ